MKYKSRNLLAIVIKVKKSRESDLLVTLLTCELGKIITVAKGTCKLNSKKRPYLEPGNLVQVQLVKTKSWPILTQACLVGTIGETRFSLSRLRRFLLYLEIIDLLLTEEELSPHLFQQVLSLRELLLQNMNNQKIKESFQALLAELGYWDQQKEMQCSVSSLVSELTGRTLHSFEYLRA